MSEWQRVLSDLDQILATLESLRAPQKGGGQGWSGVDMQILREFYADTPAWVLGAVLGRSESSVHAKARGLGLRKADDWADNPLSNSTRVDPHRGRSAQFQPGHQTWNKGKKGWCHPGAKATHFKPGNRPIQTLPIGSYRLDSHGILQRKIADTPGPQHLRWRSVHELVWIEHHGPVPKGRVVVFRPGQRTNQLELITIDRVECITRQEVMRRNSYHNRYPKEIARLIQLSGAITRKINRRSKNA